MTGEKTLSCAIRRIALAYLFINLDVHINGFNLLPDWVGCVIIWLQLDAIAKAVDSAGLLKPLAAGLSAWGLYSSLVSEPLGLLGDFPALITAAVALYFHFQLLTDLASIAHRHDGTLGRKLRRLRTAQTLFITVVRLGWFSGNAEDVWIVLGIVALQAGIMVWTMISLWELARMVESPESV